MKGGEAYFHIDDLQSHIPTAHSKMVKLHVKFDGGASTTDGLFSAEVDYHLEHKDGDGIEEGSLTIVREMRGGKWHTNIKTEAHSEMTLNSASKLHHYIEMYYPFGAFNAMTNNFKITIDKNQRNTFLRKFKAGVEMLTYHADTSKVDTAAMLKVGLKGELTLNPESILYRTVVSQYQFLTPFRTRSSDLEFMVDRVNKNAFLNKFHVKARWIR